MIRSEWQCAPIDERPADDRSVGSLTVGVLLLVAFGVVIGLVLAPIFDASTRTFVDWLQAS
jgi:hypothetical protein